MSNNVMFSNVIPQIVNDRDSWSLDVYTDGIKPYFVLENTDLYFSEKSEFDGTYIDLADQIVDLSDYFDAGLLAEDCISEDIYSGYSDEDIFSLASALQESLDELAINIQSARRLLLANKNYRDAPSCGIITDQYRINPTFLHDDYFYKNPYAFFAFPDEVCYIPQNVFDDTAEIKDEFGGWRYEDVEYGGYTYNDLYLLCNKDVNKTGELFKKLTGQNPEEAC